MSVFLGDGGRICCLTAPSCLTGSVGPLVGDPGARAIVLVLVGRVVDFVEDGVFN